MKSTRFIGTAAIGVAALLTGSAFTSGARSEPTTVPVTPPAHEHGTGMKGDICPMQVPGTTVTSADVEGGVALAFSTSAGDVAELRKRVRRMVDMHNHAHKADGTTMGGASSGAADSAHEHGATTGTGHEASGRQGMMMDTAMMMPAASASVDDIEGGARVVFRPKDPAQLDALREHVRKRSVRMAGGQCPMMPRNPEGTPAPAASPNPGDTNHEAHHTPPLEE